MTQDPIDPHDREPTLGADAAADGNSISPLPGEPGIPNVAARQRVSMSKKGLLAVALLIGSMVAVAAYTVRRVSASGLDSMSPVVQPQGFTPHNPQKWPSLRSAPTQEFPEANFDHRRVLGSGRAIVMSPI